ncbi:RHS repeat-associated core domain-containing protein [Snodgrassella communis]|uniref:RHS repeat-associated core domain-containing protein n=1 Tax=Snodgrassella communis TaxID=2946699 RepID=UPI001EF572BD|nr:RHS repeat-associated core domain-containing protein [Snodgrassella communis]
MRVAYGWKPDSDWGTSPLWQANLSEGQTLKNASYHYLISDHLGTPQLAINSGGEQSWKINSDAFGNSELDANNQITMNLRFPGQYYDAETGLSYNYFRDYDAKTGRYIQSDPIGLAGGINTYGYVGGNPLVYSDPTGEIAPAVVPAIAAAVRVGIAGIRFCSSNFRCRAAVIGALPEGLFPSKIEESELNKNNTSCSDNVYLAAPGKVSDTRIEKMVSERQSNEVLNGNKRPDRCDVLKAMVNEGIISKLEAKSTEKAWGCRNSRASKDKKRKR